MKITSAKQILENCKWANPNQLAFNLYSEMMKRSFPVVLYFDPKKEKIEIRDETIKSIIEFQNLQTDELVNIQDAIWNFVLKWKSEDDRIYMGINSKNDAIAKSTISGVGFINEDEINHSFFYIFVNTEWDIEHGISISYFNGRLDDVE